MNVGRVARVGGPDCPDCPDHPDHPLPVAVRLADGLAGLLTAGSIVVGVLWLVGRLAAPVFVPAAGAAGGAGPWWGIGLHLLIGVLGEIALRYRSGRAPAARLLIDLAVITAVAVVLWFVWG